MSETISANTTIEDYGVVSKIVEGGMGEVYRARDTKLGRDVAIKVLPAAFSKDSARLARFVDTFYAVRADGQGFLIVTQGQEVANLQFTFVVKRAAEAKK